MEQSKKLNVWTVPIVLEYFDNYLLYEHVYDDEYDDYEYDDHDDNDYGDWIRAPWQGPPS
jgi:hypothetical protein